MTIEEMIGLVIMVVLFGTMLITYTFKFIEDSCRREREKAIDEFAKWCYVNGIDFSYMAKGTDTVPFCKRVVDKFNAEQLKVGGKDAD